MFLQIRFRSEGFERRTAGNSAQFLVRDREVRSVISEFVRQLTAIEAPTSKAGKPSGPLCKSRIGRKFRHTGRRRRIQFQDSPVGIPAQFPDQLSDDEAVVGEVRIGGRRRSSHRSQSGIELEGVIGKRIEERIRWRVIKLRKLRLRLRLNIHGGREVVVPIGHGRRIGVEMHERLRDSSSIEQEFVLH